MRSPSLPHLFENAGRALLREIVDLDSVGLALREKTVVEAPTLERLLEAWLGALLDFARVQKMIFREFHVQELTVPEKGLGFVRAELIGELWDAHRHALRPRWERLAWKSVQIRQEPSGYQAAILMEGVR